MSNGGIGGNSSVLLGTILRKDNRTIAFTPPGGLLSDTSGHGCYSVAFCHRYPGLSATVLDLPPALEVARRTIAGQETEQQITLQAGDMLRDPFGSDYDVVLLFNIVHGLSPKQNKSLLRKSLEALRPGGGVVVLDQLVGKSPTRTIEAMASILALAFFQVLGGQSYSFKEIAEWLSEAGFSGSRQMRLLSSPASALVLADKTE